MWFQMIPDTNALNPQERAPQQYQQQQPSYASAPYPPAAPYAAPQYGGGGQVDQLPESSSSFLLASLELSDATVFEP